MAYVITDLNDFEITIDDGFRLITIWKQNIRFGDIVGDVITLYWHNKAQTDTEYELAIDYNDVTTPVVASAAALQTAIEGMITSGWGGGVTLTTKGDLLTHDGATETVLPVGVDGRILMADSAVPDGIKWQDPALVAGDEYFTITLSHGNHSPNDATANYFGWRYGLAAEALKFNNPAVVPMNCTIVRADMSWRAATCASSEVIDTYISVWSAAHPPVLQSDTIAIQTAFTCDATTATNNWASSGTLAIAASAGQLIWAHYIGPWVTNPINLLITMTLTCKKT